MGDMQVWIPETLVTNHHGVPLGVVKSGTIILLSREGLTRRYCCTFQRTAQYTHHDSLSIYLLPNTLGWYWDFYKYSVTWHNNWRSVDLDTEIEDNWFGSKLYQVRENKTLGGTHNYYGSHKAQNRPGGFLCIL